MGKATWDSSTRRMPLLVLECKLCGDDYLTATNFRSILFGIVYWYLAFVAIPSWYGYTVEEEVEVLSDGTSITRLVNVKNE
jgi:hypothetical protein